MVAGLAGGAVVFIGFAVPDDVFQTVLSTDPGMPVQTHRFGWSVIAALQSGGLRVRAVSAEPVSDFPHSSRVHIRGRAFRAHGVDGRTLSFLNVIGLKHVTRYLAALRTARRLRDDAAAIVVHGVHSPFLWVAIRLGRAWGVPTVAIVTDAPSLRGHRDNVLSTAMKTVDRRLILAALRRLSGVVALTEPLARDFAPGLPWIPMEGIALPLPVTEESPASASGTVVYAGGLHEAYGVADLLEAVHLGDGGWRLEVYGRGPAEHLVRRAAAQSPRVYFGGMAALDELPAIYGRADVLVNPRSPDTDLTKYSFPSKMLEYLSSGTPVITTRITNLPRDYEEHLTVCVPGAGGLAAAIDDLLSQTPERRRQRGTEAARFIEQTRGVTCQGQRLVDFLAQLADSSRRQPHAKQDRSATK